MVFQNDILAGSSGASGTSTAVHTIDQSIRFNDGDSAFMKRDYSGDGSQTTFTLSGWFKLGILNGTAHCLFATGFINGSVADFTLFFSGDQLKLYAGYNGGTPANKLITTQLFRDHSAWYHIVFVADTTNTVSTERLRLYINGSRVTEFDTETYPSQNNTLVWGDATYSHVIGASGDDTAGNLNSQTPRYHYDGYMAEIVLLDGTATDCNSFGEYNSSNIWIPKDVSGLTFGTNGFHIKGETASDLGNDSSSNNNDFTTSGLASHDQMADSPTNNFCTLNPIYRGTGSQYGVQENGNLELKFSGSQNAGQVCTQLFTTGKWYWEMRVKAGGGSANYFLSSGIAAVNDGYVKSDTNMHGTVTGEIGVNSYDGKVRFANSVTKTYTEVPFADGDILQVAVDTDNGAIYYGKNGTFMGSGDPTSGASKTNAGATWTPASYSGGWVPTAGALGGSVPIVTMNFGQEGTFSGGTTAGGNSDGNGVGNFKYSVPSGYLALCTKNLGS